LKAYEDGKTHKYKSEDWATKDWDLIKNVDKKEANQTGLTVERIKDIGEKITVLPEGAEFHKLVKKIFVNR